MLSQELTKTREFSSFSTIILSIAINKNNYLKFKCPRKERETISHATIKGEKQQKNPEPHTMTTRNTATEPI